MADEKEISNKDIYSLLQAVITKTDDIKEEIKQEIRSVKSEIFQQLEIIKKENKELKKENEILISRLQGCERKLKKNNVIIYGIKEESQEIEEVQYLLNIINEKLEINCQYTDLRDTHRIGKKIEGKIRPTCVEFVNYKLKSEVLVNAKKLKGSNIYISNDYIPEDYKKQKVLYAHLQKARGNQFKAYLKNNTLIVNGEVFTYEDLIKRPLNKNRETVEEIEKQPTQNTDVLIETSKKQRRPEQEKIETDTNSDSGSSSIKHLDKKRKQSLDESESVFENLSKRSTRPKNTNVRYFY